MDPLRETNKYRRVVKNLYRILTGTEQTARRFVRLMDKASQR